MAIQQRDYERLIASIEGKMTGATRDAINAELFNVINEFFEDTNAWSEWINLTIVANNQTYTISPQKGGMIIRLVTIFDPNRIVIPGFLSDIDNPPSATLFLTFPQTNTIAAQVLVVKNTILPNVGDNIPDAPSWLLPRWGRYVEDGLLARMYAQPKRPYTNVIAARDRRAAFRDAITIVRTAVARSNLYGGQSWRYPSNFRTNSQRGGVSTPFPVPSSFGV